MENLHSGAFKPFRSLTNISDTTCHNLFNKL